MKKLLALLLSMVMLLPAAVIPAAAASYPSVSSSKYIEFKAQESINVYKDKACKTRGTSSPSKKYNAAIAKNDVCYIYEIDSSYLKVNYPTSSGRRTGFIKRSDLLDKTTAEEYISSAKASVTVHKAQGTSSIAKKDKVWRVDPDKEYSGYYAVIYEAKSGNRAYKLGYITQGDLEKIRNGESVSKTETKSSGSATKTMTNALYGINVSGSKLTCGFDGYVRLKKDYGYRHEGIDFAYGSGKNVYSLTDGVVTFADKSTKTGLTTVAVYYAEKDKTVVYLHLIPTVKTGDKIEAGDKIGTESNRGTDAVHTHVEVRDGRRTSAAVSSDSKLVNRDPTSFWNSLGYKVK